MWAFHGSSVMGSGLSPLWLQRSWQAYIDGCWRFTNYDSTPNIVRWRYRSNRLSMAYKRLAMSCSVCTSTNWERETSAAKGHGPTVLTDIGSDHRVGQRGVSALSPGVHYAASHAFGRRRDQCRSATPGATGRAVYRSGS